MNEGFIAQSHLSNNRNDEARQEIDEEITLLEKRLLGLRAARNALAPIYDLPTEVMTTIFLLAFYSSTPKGRLSLVLSWVSQRWREIALGIPTLWTVVDTVKVDIPSYITRSHNNPLSFILPKLNAERMYCVPQVLKEQERIEHLDLRLHWRMEEEQVAFFKEFCNPIPVMKTLTLFGFRIPAPPFHQLAPCLTHLTLYECATHWPTFPSCPELTSLTITTPSTSMPIDHCLNVLRLAPKLRTLTLREVLDTTIFGPLVPVDLLDLQDLSISGERGDVLVVLLQNLVFAKVTSVVIKASHNSEPIQSAILEKVQIAIDSPNKPITSLHVATNINDGFQRYEIQYRGTWVALEFTSSLSTATTANLVASTCSGLALDDLEELDTSGSDLYLHWRFFTSTPFCWLQNLRKIIVRGRFSRSFIQYAETRTKESDEAIQSSEPGKNLDLDLFLGFTPLQDLILENLNYSRDDGVIALGHLRDYLERRNALGLRLSKLEFITRDPLEEGLKVTFEHLVGTFVGMVRKELDGDIVT